ncbi:DUF177 domain-containing protein [Taibaiella sp. KBW10]|uniref:YceD family protein n=1 Tax=Taibaiella sp. KBW10 TaxID=2153357 RepID=UPI000F5B66E9|nr:DUF177 domain-containing protein [Taibaiella sp. KBW10]RQO30702.1 DUF177 domain-containing protein [Taibaiella sp. KBW10]
MKYHREFEIAYVGLKNGEHTYTYEIGKQFFELIEADADDLEAVNIQVTVTFDKQPNYFALKFDISGSVGVACDRCGDPFTLPLWDEFNLIVKLKEPTAEDEDAEDDGDIVFLPKNETVIDLSEWIYEFIMLSIPMQRVHPEDAEGNTTCNKENLALLDKMTQQAEAEEEAEKEKNKNIWKGLDAFKNNNQN